MLLSAQWPQHLNPICGQDDALELFKKTLPGASFVQVETSAQTMKQHALAALMEASEGDKHDYRINLISMALKGKKVSFTKVVKMIDDMIALLKTEQTDDDNKKEHTCT